MSKQQDAELILRLFELRRDEEMRAARKWFFTDFAPQSAMDILSLYRAGERASAYFRMITSYWDMAAALVLHEAIDEPLFLDANTEHIFVYAKIQEFLPAIREVFQEPDYLKNLEVLIAKIPDLETKLENRRRLSALWTKPPSQ